MAEAGSTHQDLPILFLILSLAVGAVTRHLVKALRVPIPYTVLLMVLGSVLGILHTHVHLGDLDASVNAFSRMDPHLMLLLFLPALIFESAFATNFHIIWREMGQALMLAGPGVVISTILSATLARYVFDYSWGWRESLMFGAALSATDPVAVVALLRDIGASKRLATLIEAESLLNDGTAYVFFLIFKDSVVGVERSPGELVAFFCRLSFGGVLCGLALAIPAVYWLRSVFNDASTETTITVTLAYAAFWVAESETTGLHVSGVLAVVAAGLYMSKHKQAVSPQIEHSLHNVWQFISYMANTIIFIISGVIVAEKTSLLWQGSDEVLEDSVDASYNGLRWKDVGWLIFLYVMIHVIRGTVVLLLWPAIIHMGYGLTWRTGTVLVYGGLRGAVGLALALMIELETEIAASVRDRMMFIVSGIVFLTLLVNGSTSKHLLQYLGLTGSTPAGDAVFHKALMHLRHETQMVTSSLKHDKHYSGANWSRIRSLLPRYENAPMLHRPHEEEQKKKKQQEQKQAEPNRLHKRRTSTTSLSTAISRESSTSRMPRIGSTGDLSRNESTSDMNEMSRMSSTVDLEFANREHNHPEAVLVDLMHAVENEDEDPEVHQRREHEMRCEISHRLLSAMKANYWHRFEEGMITHEAVAVLVDAAETALDKQLESSGDLSNADEHDFLLAQWKLIAHFFHVPRWVRRLQQWLPTVGDRFLYGRLAFAVELATGFLAASESIDAIEKHFPEFGELDVVHALKEDCRRYRQKATEHWMSIWKSYPEIYRSIQTKHAAQHILTKEKHSIQEMFNMGVLEEREMLKMKDLVDQSIHRLYQLRPHPNRLADGASVLREIDFVQHLDEDLRNEVLHSKVRFFNRGQEVCSSGQYSGGIFVIIRGLVKIVPGAAHIEPIREGEDSEEAASDGVGELLSAEPDGVLVVPPGIEGSRLSPNENSAVSSSPSEVSSSEDEEPPRSPSAVGAVIASGSASALKGETPGRARLPQDVIMAEPRLAGSPGPLLHRERTDSNSDHSPPKNLRVVELGTPSPTVSDVSSDDEEFLTDDEPPGLNTSFGKQAHRRHQSSGSMPLKLSSRVAVQVTATVAEARKPVALEMTQPKPEQWNHPTVRVAAKAPTKPTKSSYGFESKHQPKRRIVRAQSMSLAPGKKLLEPEEEVAPPALDSESEDDSATTMRALGVGGIVGAWSFLTGRPMTGSAIADTPVQAVFLPRDVVQRILKDRKAADRLWKVAGSMLLQSQLADSIEGMFSGSALISRRCAKAQLTVTHAAQIYTMASSVLLLTGKCEDVSDPARTRYVAPYFLKNNNQVLKFAGGSRLLVFRRARRDSIASRMERHRSFHRKLNSAGTATPPMHVGRPMSREGSFERKPRRGSHHHHRRRQVSRTFKGHSARLHHQKSGILCNALRKNKSHSSLSFMVEEDEATTNGADNGTGLGSRPHGRHSSTQLYAMAEHDGNPEDEDEDDEEDDEEEEEEDESDEEE